MVEIVARQRWAEKFDAAGAPLFRKRQGKGGGQEFHHTLLPAAAVRRLREIGVLAAANDALSEVSEPPKPVFDWAWYEAQSGKTKAEAQRRLAVLKAVETGRASGIGQNSAVALAAEDAGVSAATVWNWLNLVKGVPAADWLPALAPRRKGGGVKADIDPRVMSYFKSYRLRPGPQGFEESYVMTVKYAATLGIARQAVPSCKVMVRQLRREVTPQEFDALVKGMDHVIASIPAQKRDRSMFEAMQALNIDGHKWDVFVKLPDGRTVRPMSVVLQDLYSNRIMALRTGDSESTLLTRLALGDLVKKWGVPSDLTLDNGRAFASKWITGGAKTRFRNKIIEGEPLGLLTQMGVNTHWAKPHHGQSKPIERAFRTLETIISGHPLVQGAWTGKTPDGKPHDYGKKAVPLAEFQKLLAWGVHEYNTRQGRRGANATGQSYDALFQESYRTAQVRWATTEQLRLFMLPAMQVRCHKKTAAITLYKNTFYAPELYGMAGKMVTVRFDPDALQDEPVYVYRETGEFLCKAPIQTAVGFYDVQGAKDRARLEGDLKKATRAAAQAQALISAADLAAMVPFHAPDVHTPEPRIIRPVRMQGQAARAAAPVSNRVAYGDRFAQAMENLMVQAERPRLTVLDGGLSAHPGQEGQ